MSLPSERLELMNERSYRKRERRFLIDSRVAFSSGDVAQTHARSSDRAAWGDQAFLRWFPPFAKSRSVNPKVFEPVESNLFSSIMRAFGSAGHFRFCWSAWCEADRKKAHGRGQTVGQTVNNTHNETLSVRSVRLAKTVCNTHCVCHQNSKRESDRKRQATLPKQAPDSAAINQIRLPQWAYLNCLLSCK